MKPPCPCGKRAWTSKDEADRVVIDAKIRAGLRGSTKRREQRCYPCPARAGIWHVTSQGAGRFDPADPPMPDYPPTDDEAAAELVADALRHNHDTTWAALMGEVYVEQTCRVLDTLFRNLLAQGEERAAHLVAVQSRHSVGEASTAAVERARAEHAEWRARVAHFRAAVQSRLDSARQAVKTLNTARSSDKNSRENYAHRDALRLLTLAVTRHLTDTPEPTPADRRLWAWLTVLAVPHHDDGVKSLADLVAGRHWTDTPELKETA